MFAALGAASSAIDALKALTSSKPTTGVKQDAPNLFAFAADAPTPSGPTSGAGTGAGTSISPETMNALFAAQSQSGPDASSSMQSGSLKEWFAKVDSDGDGKISKSEFEALEKGSGNDARRDDAFSKLDTDGDGSISPAELLAALKGKGHHRHHPQVNQSGDAQQSDPLMQVLDTSLNTSAANATASGNAASSYNFMNQLVHRQSSMIAAQASSSLSVSV
ncbi:EF-hand domain-containing protein [Bradyrhizobium lablabi]|uniref:EF-hand domain-containing protein n=1 Tax=Bradyrhizobium lablabi TaxID=722472 RepID=UPI001BAE0471|nr:EF-hand domain-containing protein [Bradyrhizobium lablabi]MBR1125532.1 EF-hand domain-containing protein [Bradyrhizobium lablabi]